MKEQDNERKAVPSQTRIKKSSSELDFEDVKIEFLHKFSQTRFGNTNVQKCSELVTSLGQQERLFNC